LVTQAIDQVPDEQNRRESAMPTNQRTRLWCLSTAVVFAFTLLAPVAVNAQDDVAALAPAAPVGEDTNPQDVRAARALAAQRALQSGDIGSMQEERLYAIVAAAPTWDQISGYASVEASRAAIGHATTTMTEEAALLAQFRASERALSLSLGAEPQAPAEAPRVFAAQQALQSPDLGSMQEEALLAVVAASPSWDETSGYRAVEAARAANALPAAPAVIMSQVPSDVRWAPALTGADPTGDESSGYHAFEASRAAARGATSPDSLLTALATGQRSESAHLSTVPLPGDAVRANSDDRIANALFGDASRGE
jgi:hypothetical protein